ncbi:uncharacterized protein LOC141873799 isoform X4 [Acropora palmata]|uniref:uncharacterized protein LOC141873799 isoform X4 n=1 Tax=Acropora palmata TaxID=6131 RepID=UPI003DA02B97
MDSENVEQGVSYSRRSYKRTFVYLDKEEAKATSGKRLEDLRKGGRVADITFTRNDPPSHIGRLLIANFPLLVGIDLKSLTFFKSYQSGHSMAVVSKGLLDGNRLVEEYSASHKKKVYFISIPQASARRLFNAMADTASNNHQDDDDFVMLSPPMAGVYNTHHRQEKACIQVLNEEPEVVGDVSEVLDFFGLSSRTKKIKSYVQGRTEEVASLIDKLMELNMNFPPCVTHSLDELLCQGVKDVAVCVLVIVDSLVSVEAKTYVQDIFKGLHEHHQNKMAFLFWLADSQSVEGVKVQSRFGVPGKNSVLVVLPGHIPQCVEIFNEANYDRREMINALQNAAELCHQLKSERDSLNERRLLIQEQDNEFFNKQILKEATSLPEEEEEEEDDPEVTFGPTATTGCVSLENTIEDHVIEGTSKKRKNKNKKKKNKKSKKIEEAKPEEKQSNLEN